MSTQTQTPTTPDPLANAAPPTVAAAPTAPSKATGLLAQAEAEMRDGDLERAHETLCEAADAALDALAEARGWHPDGGRLRSREIVRRLDRELGRFEVFYLHIPAVVLGTFFYDNRMDEYDVRRYAGRIGELVRRVEELQAA